MKHKRIIAAILAAFWAVGLTACGSGDTPEEAAPAGTAVQVTEVDVYKRQAVVEGVDHLTGAPIQACDLRAGAALVIAALAAQGESEISCVQYVERGYEDIVAKLRGLGADIRSVEIPGESDELEAHIG